MRFYRQLNDNELVGTIPPELGKLEQLFELWVFTLQCFTCMLKHINFILFIKLIDVSFYLLGISQTTILKGRFHLTSALVLLWISCKLCNNPFIIHASLLSLPVLSTKSLLCLSCFQQCAWELPKWIDTTWFPESWKLDLFVSFKIWTSSMIFWTISLCWSWFIALNCRNLSSNSFKDKIPAELGHIINLDTLYVIFRFFTSEIAYILIDMWTNLYNLGFQGSVWQQFLRANTFDTWWSWASSHLVSLHQLLKLHCCCIISFGFVDLKYALIFRNLSRNHLNGTLPAEFGNLRSIQIM